MVGNKNTRFQCLFVFSVMNLLFVLVSTSYANENVSFKGEKTIIDNGSKPIITNEQISQCIDMTKQADKAVNELKEKANEVEALKNDYEQLKMDLQSKRAQLDWHNQDSVDEFNQMTKKQHLSFQDYRRNVENYNLSVEHYKTRIETLKSECDGKQYDNEKATTVLSQ